MNKGQVEQKPFWTEDRITICLLIGILLLAMCLRLSGLDAKSVWQDEIFTAAIASSGNSISEVISIPLYNTALPAPPLYFLITHFFLHITDNDFILRFPALLFGVLGVATTYALGARLFGKREGLAGAFLLSLVPLHIRYSQDARFYTLLLFLSLMSLYFLYRGVFDKGRKWWIGFTVCSILNVYNHLFAFFALLAETVFVAGLWLAKTLLSVRRLSSVKRATDSERTTGALVKRAGLSFMVSLATIVLAYMPMYRHLLRGVSGGKGLEGALAGGMGFPPSLLIQVLDSWGLGSRWAIFVFLLPFLIGIVISASAHRRELWLAFCWFVVPFGVLFVLRAKHGFRPRYVLFMLPLYLLFVARGLTGVTDMVTARLVQKYSDLRGLRDLGGLGSLAVFLLAIALLSAPAIRAYYVEDRANWRAVAALLARSMTAGDVVVSPGPFPQVVLPRYEESLAEAVYMMGGSEMFFSPTQEQRDGVWFVGPAREKMRSIDSELTESMPRFFKVVFEVDDQSAARGRELKIAPVMYDDLWVLYVKEGLELQDVIQLYEEGLDVVPSLTAFAIHVTLGDLYRSEGELEQAMVSYQEAAILDPYAPEPHYGLALVYEAQGLREQHASEWQKYEELKAR